MGLLFAFMPVLANNRSGGDVNHFDVLHTLFRCGPAPLRFMDAQPLPSPARAALPSSAFPTDLLAHAVRHTCQCYQLHRKVSPGNQRLAGSAPAGCGHKLRCSLVCSSAGLIAHREHFLVISLGFYFLVLCSRGLFSLEDDAVF